MQLKRIGSVDTTTEKICLTVDKPYRKALKYLELFSHCHIFYADEGEKISLQTTVVRILNVDGQNGIVIMEPMQKLAGNNNQKPLFDIKPYFPCEDLVKEAESEIQTEHNVPTLIENETKDYEITSAGVIRNTHGQVYVECKELPSCNSKYIKILWWFHRFEDKGYRSITECNPPYENAPRTGVFATRSPVRPNPIAVTVAKVKWVNRNLKRIYINQIESFDKTPCIGILPYEKCSDAVFNSSVPKWLSHWPSCYEEQNKEEKVEMSEPHDSILQELLEGETQGENIKSCDFSVLASKKDGIWVSGAAEHNLKGVSVTIPYKKITAVVGVSGSGKSSLVTDTIYAECRRRMEYLSHNRNTLQKPRMEEMSGCIPAVIVSQQEIRGNNQSTVGTYTNAYDYLRILYAGVGVRHCPDCGNEIIPLTREKISDILHSQKNVTLYDLEKKQIEEKTLEKQIDSALQAGQGAFYAKIGSREMFLMQTKQKCFHCNKIMFDLTPSSFSYLDQESRCPHCNGTGRSFEIDTDKIIENPELSLLDGACSFYGKLRSFQNNPNANWMKGQVFGLAALMREDLNKPWKELSLEFQTALLEGCEQEVTFSYDNKRNGRKGEIKRPVEGICQIIQRLYEDNTNTTAIDKYMKIVTCNHCKGERLNTEGRMVTIGQVRYPEAASMSFDELCVFCERLLQHADSEKQGKMKTAVMNLLELSKEAAKLGIGHLHLSQGTLEISGGEGQRLKLLSAFQNHMSGVLYVFDEPSKGLHPSDYRKVADILKQLRDEGNTIMMVEHNEEMIAIADQVIEIGPGAGEKGGQLVGEGSFQDMVKNKATMFGRYMQQANYAAKKRELCNFITLEHLNYRNLKDISVKFPKGALTCICGVSGSGKTSLMKGEVYHRMKEEKQFQDVILVDQQPIGKTSKSVIATYISIMDEIRALFADTEQAKELQYDEGFFSFNTEAGQCPNCKGEGRVKIKYLEDSYLVCPDCKGSRYQRKILSVLYHQKNIDDILRMSVEEALDFFNNNHEIVLKLQLVKRVGMGYLTLGQSTTTLSGGEASRLKLSRELLQTDKKNVLYLFDEPTTGLHFSDIDHLLSLIDELISEGNTVMTIEHNKQFLTHSDWTITMGPGAGEKGGHIIRQE